MQNLPSKNAFWTKNAPMVADSAPTIFSPILTTLKFL